jgi:hypothetical protein
MSQTFADLLNRFTEARNGDYRTDHNRLMLLEETVQAMLESLADQPVPLDECSRQPDKGVARTMLEGDQRPLPK